MKFQDEVLKEEEERALRREVRARLSVEVEGMLDDEEGGKSCVRDRRGYIVVFPFSSALGLERVDVEVEGKGEGSVGGRMRGESSADECLTYAWGDISGDGARFEVDQVRVYPAASWDGDTRKDSRETALWMPWK